MSEIIEFLKTRRSVKPRDMTGAGPTAAELETILTIGARVPDHGKVAPWRFIVFEGDARKKAGEIIAQVFKTKNPQASEQDLTKARESLTEAPLVIAVVSSIKSHPKVPAWEQQLSAGASAMNIVTAATALGYGARWLTGWFSFDLVVPATAAAMTAPAVFTIRNHVDMADRTQDAKFGIFIHWGLFSIPGFAASRGSMNWSSGRYGTVCFPARSSITILFAPGRMLPMAPR